MCIIVLLKHLSNHCMHFITNSHKRFSKTNSTEPRQRVPLSTNLSFQIGFEAGIRSDLSEIWGEFVP